MATVTFIRYKSQSAGALHGVAGYVSQKQKTEQEDGWQLVKGQNCTPQLAAQEFIATRQMHRKDSPVWFYHYVQSFSPDEEITGVLAHQVAQEFVEQAWPDSEVLIATHTDAEHIHTHFIVNSVCYETGKMLRQGPSTLKNLRALSDELCMKYGFSVLEKQQPKKTKGMSSREYRSAAKGESWKFRLMNTIDQCMWYASTKEEFIALMKSEGYEVRWTDSRKNITYTTPKGMKCRDDRLHDGKYTKEVMEHEFRIRAALAHGGIEAEERFTASSNSDLSQPGGVGQFTADDQRTVSVDGRAEQGSGESGAAHGGPHSPSAGGFQPEGAVPHPGADGSTGAGCGGDTGDTATGWEAEREAFFSARHQAAQTESAGHSMDQSAVGTGGPGADWAGAVGGVVQLGHALERGQGPAPVKDATTTHYHADSKALRKERQKKIAQGHAEDDHEEEQTWQQTM